MSYTNRNRGRGGNRPYNNQNNKNRRAHDFQQQPSSNNQELNNGVYANERFVHTTMALIGSVTRVTVKVGNIYEGVFKTYSPQFEVVLEKVHLVDSANPSNIPSRENIHSQMVFKLEDIAAVHYTNVDPNYAITDGFTDGAISRKANGQAMERELQPWVSDANLDEAVDEGEVLEAGKSNGWDADEMFRINRDKFQISSTYDPNMTQYTTPLPSHNTEDFRTYEENAVAMAREIESSSMYRQRIELENAKDEETLHSAVVREPQCVPLQKQARPRQDGGQHLDRGGHSGPRNPKPNVTNNTSSSSNAREVSPPISKQQVQSQHASKTGGQQTSHAQAGVELVSTPVAIPHGNYSDAVVKKHITPAQHHSGQIASGQQSHHSKGVTATSPHSSQSAFSQSSSQHGSGGTMSSNSSGTLTSTASGLNGYKHSHTHHTLSEQAQAPAADRKEFPLKVHHSGPVGSGTLGSGVGTNAGGLTGHQQQNNEPASGGGGGGGSGSHHHHYQQPAHHKEASREEQIKDLREFQVNFNLTPVDVSLPSSTSQQQPVEATSSAVESAYTHVSITASAATTAQSSSISENATPVVASVVVTPAATAVSKPSAGTIASLTTENTTNPEGTEKRKEVTSTLNPNANEFRPRTVSIMDPSAQIIQPMIQAVNLPQQQSAQVHIQQHKTAHLSANQIAVQQQMMPSTVASPPIIYSHTNPAGLQQLVAAGHHTPVLYCPQTVTPRFPAGNKRATVSARGNNEMPTPQTASIMAGAPLISQNGLPTQMFVTPQQMMINSPYNIYYQSFLTDDLNYMTPESVRFMLQSPLIIEPGIMAQNPMLLPTQVLPHLTAPPHGTQTAAVMPTNIHPLLQQQQLVAQQQQQQSQQPANNSNGGNAATRPASNGSGAPTPVHYQPGPPMSQHAQSHNQGVAHHQQQQLTQAHQVYHGTPPASLTLHGHPQPMAAMPTGAQLPATMQSQLLFSPFIPTFSNHHHPQSAGFTATIPPPSISGAIQGQMPPGATLHHHQLMQHHQLQPMIIASQNQQVAAAQLGQFVAVPGLAGVPQGPPNIASPHQLLYGMPPTIQSSIGGQNFQHGQ